MLFPPFNNNSWKPLLQFNTLLPTISDLLIDRMQITTNFYLPEDADLAEVVLGGIDCTGRASQRAADCTKRRLVVKNVVMQLEQVLNECVEVVGRRPSKTDKSTAETYHSCFRRLHWVVRRCRQVQDVVEILEDYDPERQTNQKAAREYSGLGVDIVASHEHAHELLQKLCRASLPDYRESLPDYKEERNPMGMIDWLVDVACSVQVCGSRVCIRNGSYKQRMML